MTNDRKKVATPTPIDEASADSPLRTLPPPRPPSIPVDIDLEAFAEVQAERDADDEETATRQMSPEQRTRIQQLASLITRSDGDEEETATRPHSPEQKARINAMAASKPPPQPVDVTPSERMRRHRG
ncbi:hypothetical protein AKJ09_09475 [Labilithrix luteola]|uniref:Uncharacterized protein n=1 Tax=Labilithrix luteola TaxID=1391654 RepID=A0A0K1QAX4_9BACT|nr:hypothetical protein [Labilithrix luteola]AKV02812.1 hypothetical protein AKJ09_09475 [Labilithrix luteola]